MTKRFVLGLSLALALCGCARHPLSAANPRPEGFPQYHHSTAYFWGAAQELKADCGMGGLDQVSIRQTLGNTLLSAITLGIVSPIEYEYYCRKVEAAGGSRGAPSAAPSAPSAPSSSPAP